MKRVLMAMAVMAAMAGSVQAAQKPEAAKGIEIHEAWWQKTTIEIGVDVVMWFHDRFDKGPYREIRPPQGEPQNAPVNPGELSE